MTPQEAIEAAELAELETRYRLQFGREMYEAGRQAAEADMAVQWARAAAAVRRPSPTSRSAGGDRAAALTSPTRGPATSPAVSPPPGRKQNQNLK